ncbi:MAG: DUF378 domain-containing protein [Parcubacteria group bacterium CG11_big_fil_rev_8_21_14_0_20_39_22]|nr:MAG: DUF378 domain-containing protein [Parcubacteria group bacterium CG11_big_fil_rev_8_21_14_0_20_39_22]
MKGLHIVTFILLIVGGLNWGVYALFGTDIGALVGGMESMVAKVIYLLVGLAAIVEILTHKKGCRACCGESKSSSMSNGQSAPMM